MSNLFRDLQQWFLPLHCTKTILGNQGSLCDVTKGPWFLFLCFQWATLRQQSPPTLHHVHMGLLRWYRYKDVQKEQIALKIDTLEVKILTEYFISIGVKWQTRVCQHITTLLHPRQPLSSLERRSLTCSPETKSNTNLNKQWKTSKTEHLQECCSMNTMTNCVARTKPSALTVLCFVHSTMSSVYDWKIVNVRQ